MKSKTKPANARIKRLLEVISAYSFSMYDMKGKDMTLSDFLSKPWSEVKSKLVTKNETKIMHLHKYHLNEHHKYPGGNFLDPPETVTHQSQGNYPENTAVNFLESQLDKEIESNSPYQEAAIEQEFTRLTENYYRHSPDLKQLINTSEVVYKFSSIQIDFHKEIKLIEKKILEGKHLPMTIKEIQAGHLNSLYFKNINLYSVQISYLLLSLQ